MGKENESNYYDLSTEKLCTITSKKECPGRIVRNAVGGIVLGLFGGFVYQVVVTLSRDQSVERAASSALRRSPVIAVSCGIVLAVYSALECSLEHLRGTPDDANSLLAGAATGALLGADPGIPTPVPTRTEPCYGEGGFAGNRWLHPRIKYALLGAVAFGLLDGPVRRELCEEKPTGNTGNTDKNKKKQKK